MRTSGACLRLGASLVAAALGLACLPGCYGIDSLFERPRATYLTAEAVTDGEGQTLKLLLAVENPNVIALELVKLSVRVEVDGVARAEGAAAEALTVPPHGTGELTVPVELRLPAGQRPRVFAARLVLGFVTSAGVLEVPVSARGPWPPAIERTLSGSSSH